MQVPRSVARPRRLVALSVLLALAAPLAACSSGSDTETATSATTAVVTTLATTVPTTDTAPPVTTAAPAVTTTAPPSAVAGLTAEEVADLRWMREEEKLALDVYTALGATWGLEIFANIARSEQTHTDSVKALLDRYGIADPAAGQPAGVFTDPALQALHDQLLAKGNTSLVAALEVGATIEDLDIVDLRDRASATAAIDAVYDNLEKGSRNHLRAFVGQLDTRGVPYTPQYLTADAYAAIIGSPTERGAA